MPSLFTELRRRNVFKVGAAYAIVAWLLIEVTSVVLPTFDAPRWIAQTITFLLIIGFPIAILLAWAYEMTPEGIKAAADVPRDSITPATGQRLNYVILGLVVLAVGFLVTDQYVLDQGIRASVVGTSRSVAVTPAPTPEVSSRPVRRTFIPLGPRSTIPGSRLNAHIALSPDARRLAYVFRVEGRIQLYLRELDQVTARAMSGTDGGANPFFSPDGEWVGFNVDGDLYKVSVRGGPTQRLAGEMRGGGGGFWTTDDTIIFSADTPEGARLHRIAVVGGMPEPLDVDSEASRVVHAWPHVLPSGDTVLFTTSPPESAGDGQIALLSLGTGETRTLIESAYNARYAPSGHIVFMRSGSLWAVPFDLERLEKIGPEVPVVNGVQTESQRGATAYTFSDDGLLVYLPGIDRIAERLSNFVWVDREGREEILDVEPQTFWDARLSPDGQRLAVRITDSTLSNDVWIYDLTHGTRGPLTFNPGSHNEPIWTPDSERVVFRSDREDGESGLYWKSADGAGQEERLTTSPFHRPVSFSPDGNQLVFEDYVERDLHVLSLDGERTSEPLLQSAIAAAISPDGRWLVYVSDESGEDQVYVRPFPDVNSGGPWQVSTAGRGSGRPRWGPQGRELFYLSDGSVMVVSVEGDSAFLHGRPEALFTRSYAPDYSVSLDGQRFLMMKSVAQITELVPGQTILIAVDNWFEELNRLAPPSP